MNGRNIKSGLVEGENQWEGREVEGRMNMIKVLYLHI
jgi:hypothetical protein